MDHARAWVQQYHLGALRDTNTRMRQRLGADSGLDSIGDFEMARPMARFFDRLDSTNQLARTILYNLNPRDNELFATMIGNFQDGSIAGKMQYGSAWWFHDQIDGMPADSCCAETLHWHQRRRRAPSARDVATPTGKPRRRASPERR